ncbi:alpha/beta hydrolase [Ruminococcus flavefaciens]|uniref:alpha/beta hydrolase n=1 Tax=Ruminococcus flavefaciens TaxID=1265 RepID=UPI00031ECBEE|nr:alpha/beta hydrolase-fold protein [Ruminococcus flavefaciens]
MKTVEISGRTCHIIINGAELPTIYWGEMKNSSETIEKVLAHCEDVKCNYIVYEVEDWNADFSPWEFMLNKKMSFSGGGRKTLDWLLNECIFYCEKEYGLTGERILCGYSLAGLFSLWAFYESQAFGGVISCSGSLWFGEWISYAERHIAPQNSSVYLSLGNREEKARDHVMATVGDCTRRQYELVCGDKNVSRHILECNDGGHFKEPEKRIAKGIKWITGEV